MNKIETRSDDELWTQCDKCGIQVSDMEMHKKYFCQGTDSAMTVISQQDQVIFRELIENAKRAELESWKKHNVMQLIDPNLVPSDANVVSMRWVLTWKNEGVAKARLVARGYEDKDLSSLRTDSPTVSKLSLRLFIQFSCSSHYQISTIDLKTAFLQGFDYSSDREIYSQPPEDVHQILKLKSPVVFRLLKSCYGLNDAPRNFYLKLSTSLEKYGCVVSKFDRALFRYENSKKVTSGLIVLHVDDLLLAGDEEFHSAVISQLLGDYEVGRADKGSFQYCGTKITCHSDGSVSLSQAEYSRKIREVPDSNSDDFRTSVGRLNWLITATRPDLSFSTIQLSIVQRNPTDRDFKLLNKTVRQAQKNSDVCIRIVPLVDPVLLVYSDSSFANNPDFSSQGAYLVFFAQKIDTSYRVSLIDWSSTKLKRITRSTLSSETLALSHALDHTLYISSMWQEITGTRPRILAHTDSCSLFDAIHSDKQSVSEKRLLIEISAIRQMIKNQQIDSVNFVPTSSMVADILTKKISDTHQNYHFFLGILKKNTIPVPS